MRAPFPLCAHCWRTGSDVSFKTPSDCAIKFSRMGMALIGGSDGGTNAACFGLAIFLDITGATI